MDNLTADRDMLNAIITDVQDRYNICPRDHERTMLFQSIIRMHEAAMWLDYACQINELAGEQPQEVDLTLTEE